MNISLKKEKKRIECLSGVLIVFHMTVNDWFLDIFIDRTLK